VVSHLGHLALTLAPAIALALLLLARRFPGERTLVALAPLEALRLAAAGLVDRPPLLAAAAVEIAAEVRFRLLVHAVTLLRGTPRPRIRRGLGRSRNTIPGRWIAGSCSGSR
jgi:hypothetical protein